MSGETPEEERARRLGLNESVFRAVNEEIESLQRGMSSVGGDQAMHVICECGQLACAQQIEIEIPAYERVRADGARFVVVPGHELPDVEDVVEETAGYKVVRKRPGTPERVARDTDPRG